MQYIAEKGIVAVVELDEKTPQGNDMVEVCFEGELKEKMPKKRFELIVTEEVSDATTVQNRVRDSLSSLILGMFNEYGVKMGETEPIFGCIAGLVNTGFTKASDLLWGNDFQGVSLLAVNDVLKKNYDKENNNGAGSEGSGPDSENKG